MSPTPIIALLVVVALLALAPANRRALDLLLAERTRVKARAIIWGFSLAALCAGPAGAVIGAAVLARLGRRRHDGLDPFKHAARVNALTAFFLGLVVIAVPFILSRVGSVS